MDLKFIQDETDLSVGLSVTCSTSPDDYYNPDGTLMDSQPDSSASSYFLMGQYPPESNPHSIVHSTDFDFNQSLLMNGHDNGINQSDEFGEEVADVLSLDDYKYNKQSKHDISYSSSMRLHPDARKMQVCKTCGKTFKFQTSLLRHNNKVHMSRYQCTTCCRLFSRQSYLDVHTSKPGTSCYIAHKVKKSRKRN